MTNDRNMGNIETANQSNLVSAHGIFNINDKRMNECNNSVKNINVKRSLKDNLSELINLCMEIYEKNKIIVTTNLFFWILEELYTENGVRIINWIKIFLESLTTLEQKEAFLWVMQDEWLRQRWFDVNAFM